MRIWLLFIAALLIAGCDADTPEGRAKQAESRREFNQEILVSGLAEDAVKLSLKWPKDASIGWFPETAFNADRTAASVKGTVTAKNSFGASLTHDYVVVVTLDEGKWTVHSVGLGDKVVYRRQQNK